VARFQRSGAVPAPTAAGSAAFVQQSRNESRILDSIDDEVDCCSLVLHDEIDRIGKSLEVKTAIVASDDTMDAAMRGNSPSGVAKIL